MLRDKAIIGYMGLSEREISVIHSLFKLTKKFNHTYELPRENERRFPDVVFVCADNSTSVKQWKQYTQTRDSAIPIYVSTGESGFTDGISIRRPVVLKKLMHVLESAQILSARAVELADAESGKSQKTSFNILVVDDSLPVRTYMQQKLGEISTVMTRIDFAESGEDAIDKMKRDGYDLVFMDVMMPGIDGYKTCKWIKANKPTQVVMLTSRSSPFDKVRGAMSGCDSYLVKPPQDSDLNKVILSAIDKVAAKRRKTKINTRASA